MRCDKCNVELPENYTRCPLCGSQTTDGKMKLKGLSAVPYSDKPASPEEKQEKVKTDFSPEKIKAYFNL